MSPYDLPTPALLIDRERALENIRMMQEKADRLGLALRPHIKTHRMPYFAKLQMEAGACGIACAKIGEAEVMADAGIGDIFIANEVIGRDKYERLRDLARRVRVRAGIDNVVQLAQMEEVFEGEKPLEVLIEYEVGEVRSGVVEDWQLTGLVSAIKASRNVVLKGIFSHEGHTYKAEDASDCRAKAKAAYERTVRAADIIRSMGVDIDTVSIGATPSVMLCDEPEQYEGVTELRLGTYIFFDVGQSKAIGDFSRCAATVLASVISKPYGDRVVLDAGAKALVSQNRPSGICATNGFGAVKGAEHITVDNLYDEHAVLNSAEFRDGVQIGDKVGIIPSHICPTVNLYDKAYLVSGGRVIGEIPVACRGRSV
ncbi:MAG: alanine racemase [Clostridia bacterium]|nr:alanine racemase [Clostridia bacterium]